MSSFHREETEAQGGWETARDCKVASRRTGVQTLVVGFLICVLNHHVVLFSVPLGVGPFGLVKAVCPPLVHFEKASPSASLLPAAVSLTSPFLPFNLLLFVAFGLGKSS